MLNILICDQHPTCTDRIIKMIANNGDHYDLAQNDAEVLEQIRNNTFNVLLYDTEFAGTNNLDLLATLKIQLPKETAIIVMGSLKSIDMAQAVLHSGAREFIIKPFDEQLLYESIKNIFQDNESSVVSTINQPENSESKSETASLENNRSLIELSILQELGKRVASPLEMHKIVSAVLEIARRVLKADYAALIVFKSYSDQPLIELAYDLHEEDSGHITTLESVVIEWVATNKKTLLFEDVNKNLEFKKFLNDQVGLESMLAAPFLKNDRALGGMVLFNSKGRPQFLSKDLQFVTILTSLVTYAIENAQLCDELKKHYKGTIRALVSAVENKDTCIYGHSTRVAQYALLMGKQLKLSKSELIYLEYVALLHDIGKIAVDKSLLQKTQALTDEEWILVKSHSIVGENILQSIQFLPEAAKIVRHHHERIDGSGYPDGLKGHDIPLFARIISIADAFDSMTSGGAIRNIMDQSQAIIELNKNAGTQFDSELVASFLTGLKTLLK